MLAGYRLTRMILLVVGVNVLVCTVWSGGVTSKFGSDAMHIAAVGV